MARSLSAAEHQEYGRQLFKAGNYEKALLQFTSALEKYEDVPIPVLDNRASTLEKLSRFDDAIRDGTRMIQLDKQDVRGYLRTGRLLQRSEDPTKRELALKIYAKGLKSVPASHEHYRILQSVHCRLTIAMAPQKSVDPFTVLPAELVDMVLSYLGFQHMIRCLGVSKSWKRFLVDRPEVWRTIDFSKARRAIRGETVTRYLNRGRRHIKSFTFHRHSNPGSLMALLKAAPNLESLRFCTTQYGTHSIVSALEASAKVQHRPNCDWLKTLDLGERTNIGLDGVTQILRHCSGLVTAHFNGIETKPRGVNLRAHWTGPLPFLRELRLHCSVSSRLQADRWSLAQLFELAPMLKSLYIHDPLATIDLDQPNLPPLESLHLAGDVRPPSGFPPMLQELRLNVTYYHLGATWPQLEALKDLRVVEAAGSFTVTLSGQLHQVTNDLPWQHLVLDWRGAEQYLIDTDFSAIPPGIARCPDLQRVGIHGRAVSDDSCQQLAEAVPQMRQLSLADTVVTGVGIKMLVLGMSNLAVLNLTDCAKLSIDAVEWARAKGLKVKHVVPAEGKFKGKKIRHG